MFRAGVRRCLEQGVYLKEKNPGLIKPKRNYLKKKLNNSFELLKDRIKNFILSQLIKASDGFPVAKFEISNDVSN